MGVPERPRNCGRRSLRPAGCSGVMSGRLRRVNTLLRFAAWRETARLKSKKSTLPDRVVRPEFGGSLVLTAPSRSRDAVLGAIAGIV